MKTAKNNGTYRYETPHFDEERIDFKNKGVWHNQMEYYRTAKYERWSWFVAGMIIALLITLASIVTYFIIDPIQETNDLNEHKNELFID